MKLYDAVKNAYNTRWSYNNNFTVQIIPKGSAVAGIANFDEDELNLSIVNIKTPDVANSGIEAYVGNRWFLQNGRDNMYKFSIVFRDKNQMELYQRFQTLYHTTKEYYFDEVVMDVILMKDADWHPESQVEIIRLENAMVDGISNLDFNNTTEAAVAEFTVEFKCTDPMF